MNTSRATLAAVAIVLLLSLCLIVALDDPSGPGADPALATTSPGAPREPAPRRRAGRSGAASGSVGPETPTLVTSLDFLRDHRWIEPAPIIDPFSDKTLRVTVVRPDGTPVADADVLIADPLALLAEKSVFRARTAARTDANGTAELRVRAGSIGLVVLAAADGATGRASSIDVPVASGTVDERVVVDVRVVVQPAPTRRVACIVVDEFGRPVNGAAVHAWARTADRDVEVSRSTAGDGRADLGFVPLASADTAVSIVSTAPGFVPAQRSLDGALDGSDDDIVLRLVRAATARGTVTDDAGHPVRRATVAAGGVTVFTDDAGRFELAAVPRDGCDLTVRHLGFAPAFTPVRADGPVADVGTIVLRRGLILEAIVRDVSGQPVADATARLTLRGRGLDERATSDDDGRVAFTDLVAEEHVLVVEEPATSSHWASRRRASVAGLIPGGEPTVVILDGRGTLLLRFIDAADDKPLSVPEVTIEATARGHAPLTADWEGAGLRVVRFDPARATGSAGPPDPGAAWDLTVRVPGRRAATVRGVTLSPYREEAVEVRFPATVDAR